MNAMTHELHSMATGPAPRGAVEDNGLICRLEGKLRGSSRFSRCSEGIRFVHDLEADIVDGPFTGGRLTGLDEFTISPDGTVLLVGAQTISSEREPVALELRGYVTPTAEMEWPSPQVMATPGYEFPDADLVVRGAALVHTADPRHQRLDGMTATIEGWVNFESGELEVEARLMQ